MHPNLVSEILQLCPSQLLRHQLSQAVHRIQRDLPAQQWQVTVMMTGEVWQLYL